MRTALITSTRHARHTETGEGHMGRPAAAHTRYACIRHRLHNNPRVGRVGPNTTAPHKQAKRFAAWYADLTFNKLNPRWCFKGGGMDRGVYKAHGETLRMVTFRIILAMKAGYYTYMSAFLLDCSNAFQSTRTDGESDCQPDLYCWPAPGFEKRENGRFNG